MSELTRQAVAAVHGRRTTSTGLIVIWAALIAALLTLGIPLLDGRENLEHHYDRPAWEKSWFIESLPDSTAGTQAIRTQLEATDGVKSVDALYVVPAETRDTSVDLWTYDQAFGYDIAAGRNPKAGHCEALVTRDIPGARIGQQLSLTVNGDEPGDSTFQIALQVVGIISRGYPLLDNAVVTPCDLSGKGLSPSALVVKTDPGTTLPGRYFATSLDSMAKTRIRDASSSGMLRLVFLLMGIVAAVVTFSTCRWSVRSRKDDLATLRLWGYSRPQIAAQIGVEHTLLWLLTLPFGIAAGVLGTWQFMRHVGDVVDPGSGLYIARPSPSTLLLVCGAMLLAILVCTVCFGLTSMRSSVSAMLRRRGE